jgi:hypothetical protein
LIGISSPADATEFVARNITGQDIECTWNYEDAAQSFILPAKGRKKIFTHIVRSPDSLSSRRQWQEAARLGRLVKGFEETECEPYRQPATYPLRYTVFK